MAFLKLPVAFGLLLLLSWTGRSGAWIVDRRQPALVVSSSKSSSHRRSQLSMGLFDSISNFLQNREGDFVKMSPQEKEFGPGPLILLYNIPPGIEDDEIQDMIGDGAPLAWRQGVRLCQLTEKDADILDQPLQEALEKIASGRLVVSKSPISASSGGGLPVLLFSGFRNDEMMAVYDIIGEEIYKELSMMHPGQQVKPPACAKAVPNAMNKPCRLVLEEILGDQQEAWALGEEE